MAKMTVAGITYEGTPEEIISMVEAVNAMMPTDDAIPTTAQNPKSFDDFAKGDKVRLLSGGGKYPLLGFDVGKEYVVSDTNDKHSTDGVKSRKIRLITDGFPNQGFATPEQLEKIADVAPAEVTPQYKTEKRHVKVGERILITAATATRGLYKDGDIHTVTSDKDYLTRGSVEVVGVDRHIWPEEYEVIVEPTQAKPEKPNPADKLSHKGADYTLVQRKAQAGDVVVPSENNNCYFTNGKTYGPVTAKGHIVDNDGDTLTVYSPSNGRSEANVLVYEKVAEEEPKRFPQDGDIVRVTNGYGPIKNGDIGVVTIADRSSSPKVRVGSNEHHVFVEIVALAKDRVDIA